MGVAGFARKFFPWNTLSWIVLTELAIFTPQNNRLPHVQCELLVRRRQPPEGSMPPTQNTRLECDGIVRHLISTASGSQLP